MSLKDDFLEALRSVKRDFLRDYDEPQRQEPPVKPQEAFSAREQVQTEPDTQAPLFADANRSERVSDEELGKIIKGEFTAADFADNSGQTAQKPAEAPEQPVIELELHNEDLDGDDEASFASDVDPAPFRTSDSGEPPPGFDAPDILPVEAESEVHEGRRIIFDDYDARSMDDGERTIISKNTVVRGALQTEDSVRMFGQILGDIDCKSNILVAGRVRGNTSAANAYIINAQVDGNLLCDDVINVTDDAWILGNIRAQQADIDGKIKGNIEIRHTISIGSNSSIIGNISTDELEIKRGAFVNGQVMMYSPSRDVIDRFDRFDQ